MHLETTETHASLALAIVPPGNILRDLATIRGKLFTLNSLQGSRAWFDFPVLAWLGRCLDGGKLASIAAALQLPLEFGPLQWEDDYLTLPIPEGFDPAVLSGLDRYVLEPPDPERAEEPSAGLVPDSGKWCYGPFPSGKGLICAILNSMIPQERTSGTGKSAILAEATRLVGKAPGSNVYSLALVEVHWYPGPNYGSSWAILSSAVAGRIRGTGRPVPANGTSA
jgi:hypothetical protein